MTTLNDQHQARTVILATGTGMACEDGGGGGRRMRGDWGRLKVEEKELLLLLLSVIDIFICYLAGRC